MAVEKITYIRDYEKRSRRADAVERDPADADAIVIVLPVIRIERYEPVLTPRQRATERRIMGRYERARAREREAAE